MLLHCSLDKPLIAYDAVSYVWGLPERIDSIQLSDRPFGVIKWVITALYHMCLEISTKTLWIDAICINQADDAERSQQVCLMADVYHKAKEVIV